MSRRQQLEEKIVGRILQEDRPVLAPYSTSTDCRMERTARTRERKEVSIRHLAVRDSGRCDIDHQHAAVDEIF